MPLLRPPRPAAVIPERRHRPVHAVSYGTALADAWFNRDAKFFRLLRLLPDAGQITRLAVITAGAQRGDPSVPHGEDGIVAVAGLPHAESVDARDVDNHQHLVTPGGHLL